MRLSPWSSSSGGPCSTTTRLHCIICKRNGHTNHLCCHSRSCNHCKKTGHTERGCFNLHPELLVRHNSRESSRDVLPFILLQHDLAPCQLVQFNFYLPILQISIIDLLRLSYSSSTSQYSPDPLPRSSLLPRVCLLFGF